MGSDVKGQDLGGAACHEAYCCIPHKIVGQCHRVLGLDAYASKDGSSINIVEEGLELFGLIREAAVVHESIPALAGIPSHLWGEADGRGGMLKVGQGKGMGLLSSKAAGNRDKFPNVHWMVQHDCMSGITVMGVWPRDSIDQNG
jgi:hypothetical protein